MNITLTVSSALQLLTEFPYNTLINLMELHCTLILLLLSLQSHVLPIRLMKSCPFWLTNKSTTHLKTGYHIKYFLKVYFPHQKCYYQYDCGLRQCIMLNYVAKKSCQKYTLEILKSWAKKKKKQPFNRRECYSPFHLNIQN